MKINPDRLKGLLRRMTDIYSPSGKEEELLLFLCGYLSEKGYTFIRQPVSDGRFNIIVTPERKEAPLALVGHLDTVFAYDFDEYGFKERRGKIQGLGVADMKSGCAAMIEAFTRYLEAERAHPTAALALVVGEEENSDGAMKLLEEYRFKTAVIGEPTEMVPCFGHYGYIEMELRLSGLRRHASLSGTARNAPYSMLKVLLSAVSYLGSFSGKVRYNIRDLHSSDSGFSVPEKCSVWLDIHVHPEIKIRSFVSGIKKRIRQYVKGLDIKNRDVHINVEDYPGYKMNPQWPGFKKIHRALEKNGLSGKTGLFESHSDANIMRLRNVKPIILGPGKLAKAHTKDESISFSQVKKASQTYLDLISLI